jgi:hypothetical protein
VAASVPDNPIVEWFLSNTMVHSVINRAKSVKAPEQLTDKQAQAGFSIYKNTCVYCQGRQEKIQLTPQKALIPTRLPKWLARLIAGEHIVMMMTETRASSNAKAKRDLSWRPMHVSWRQGFAEVLAQAV